MRARWNDFCEGNRKRRPHTGASMFRSGLFFVLVVTSRSDAEPDDTWRYQPSSDLAIDAGLVVGFPAVLPTGLTRGIGAGVTRGDTWAYGARAAWTTATEASTTWTVTHSDLRLRATGALQHVAGRGTFGLRLGLGGTLVHESRTRNQGARAGLMGSDLHDSTFAFAPAADLEGVVALHVRGPWSLVMSGGPTLTEYRGEHGSWSAELGVAWQP
jgi:hypothetical protein